MWLIWVELGLAVTGIAAFAHRARGRLGATRASRAPGIIGARSPQQAVQFRAEPVWAVIRHAIPGSARSRPPGT